MLGLTAHRVLVVTIIVYPDNMRADLSKLRLRRIRSRARPANVYIKLAKAVIELDRGTSL